MRGPDPGARHAAHELNRSWNALVGDGSLPAEADEAAQGVIRLHARDDAPNVEPAFADQLLDRLVAEHPATSMTQLHPHRSSTMHPAMTGAAEPVRWPTPISSRKRRLAPRLTGWTDLIAIAAVVMLVFGAVLADRGGAPPEQPVPHQAMQPAATPASDATEEPSETTMYRGNAAQTGEFPGPGPDGVPTLAWKKQVDELSGDNVAAAGGRVFYPAFSDQTQTFDLRAAYLSTGNDLWTAPIDVTIGSVPAVAQEMVYVDTATGLKALDATTGAVVWTLPAGEATTYISPIVHDGVVYVTGSGDSITALDGSDGRRLWSTPLPGTEPSEEYLGFLRHAAVSGEFVYVQSATGVISAFDRQTGEVAWTQALEGSSEEAFLVSEGVVAVTAVDYPIADGPRPVRLHALDAATGDPLWGPIELPVPATLAAADGVLFLVGQQLEKGTVTAYDIRTGESLWTLEMGGSPSSPSYVDGQLFVLSSQDGTVRRIDVANGTVNWSVYLGARGAPVIADGLLVASGFETIYAVSGEPPQTTPTVTDAPVDLSGLPRCEPPRTPPDAPLTGEPEVTIDAETRVIEPEGEPGRTIDGRPVEGTSWPQILTENVPDGQPASAAQTDGVEETIAAMAACSQRPGSEAQLAGFFSDDFYRRGIVEPGPNALLAWSIQPDEEQMEDLEVFVLEEGRVAASAITEPGYGTLMIFVEIDGNWLIDEVYQVVPEYQEGPQG